MKTILRSAAILACLAGVPQAWADNCTLMVGKTMCVAFHYSSGGRNSYSAVFNADGTFTLLESPTTTGTYSCAGRRGLVDVEYLFGGLEQQSWYARAGSSGNSIKGNGKSISNGYMYDFATQHVGACTSNAASTAPAKRQDQ